MATAAKKDPPQTADKASDTGDSIVDRLFNQAYEINEEQQGLNTRRNGTRDSLRSLRASGVLSEEQAAEVEELYPTVIRARKSGDEQAGQDAA